MFCLIFCSLAVVDWFLLRKEQPTKEKKRKVYRILWFIVPMIAWNAGASHIYGWPNPFDVIELMLGWSNSLLEG
ncbi:hypothetical protein [Paenibacillus lemnae]|uniref:Uncharacterized protein n=1 Tax=Paenibacillus lemnae TaxID=1330551 RepID=A0A848M4H8_PAELE|nr:hypothetical protein [Paenibacillus lemnae]NMO95978.1 hypothetical protein [Paenibacillus lemnae]